MNTYFNEITSKPINTVDGRVVYKIPAGAMCGNGDLGVVFDNDENLVFTARMATQSSKTADEYAVDFKNILGLYDVGINGFDGAIISTVVPSFIEIIPT